MKKSARTKWCCKCDKVLPISSFGKNKARYDKVQSACKPCLTRLVRTWQKKNKQKVREYVDCYQKRNPGKINAKTKAYACSKANRTPKWADLKAIELFYNNCPKGYEVDHIVPLNGETVSGLHVLNNLQYLPISENRRKSNKFDLLTNSVK